MAAFYTASTKEKVCFIAISGGVSYRTVSEETPIDSDPEGQIVVSEPFSLNTNSSDCKLQNGLLEALYHVSNVLI